MKHITLRDLFWLILVAAILAAWWADRSQTQQELSRLKKEAEDIQERLQRAMISYAPPLINR